MLTQLISSFKFLSHIQFVKCPRTSTLEVVFFNHVYSSSSAQLWESGTKGLGNGGMDASGTRLIEK